MKLARIRQGGKWVPALWLSGGTFANVATVLPDIDPINIQPFAMRKLVEKRDDILGDGDSFPRIVDPTPNMFGPIIHRPPNVIGIGLNYADHCRECNYPVPGGIEVFMKHTGSVCGASDPLPKCPIMAELDYEVELALVIGKANVGRVAPENALDLLAGYTMANDVSERKFQMSGKNWTRGKSFGSFSPIGPLLVTPDEIPDPQNLNLTLSVNGEVRQNSSTSQMVFGVRQIVSQLTETFRLLPGDVIVTGTPPGVCFRPTNPRPYLQVGDKVAWSITGLGEASHTVVASN